MKNKVIVTVSGGMVSGVYATDKNIQCCVLDGDNFYDMTGVHVWELLDTKTKTSDIEKAVKSADSHDVAEARYLGDLAGEVKIGIKEGTLHPVY
mgnify:CR=1 FL=1